MSAPRRGRERPARRAAPARRVPAARRDTGGRREVEGARRELDHAAEAVRAAAAGLASVADRIGAEALETERGSLAAELAAEQLLRDVAKLQRAFAGAAAGTLGPELEALRTLPDALLDWAERRLGVAAHLAIGQELDVPAGRLSAFALDGTLPAGGGLVRVRVLAPGWKRGARVLVPPRAMIVRG